MAPTEIISVPPNTDSKRLDLFLAEKHSSHTRSYFNKLIKNKQITVNGESVKSGYIIHAKDKIKVNFPEITSHISPADIPLDLVYEDDDIIVVNKPSGMVVHPGKGTEGDTLVNALIYYSNELSSSADHERPGIVHRLDKNTSGLIVVAKNDKAHHHLRQQFDIKSIKRIYWALVWGNVTNSNGTIETFINRSKKDPTKMAVANSGRLAITHFKVLENFEYVTLLEVNLDTGRTHQIRVHMKYIHHPVVGDPDYNGRDSQLKQLPQNLIKRGKHLLNLLPHQALHAKKLTFLHPSSNKQVKFESDLPSAFAEAITKLPSLFLL